MGSQSLGGESEQPGFCLISIKQIFLAKYETFNMTCEFTEFTKIRISTSIYKYRILVDHP